MKEIERQRLIEIGYTPEQVSSLQSASGAVGVTIIAGTTVSGMSTTLKQLLADKSNPVSGTGKAGR